MVARHGNAHRESDEVTYWTTDYEMFKIDPANREIVPRKVAGLVAAIRQINLLNIYAIVVDEDMNVIDGQHRLAAARVLGVPIYYKISGTMKIEHAALINENTTNWQHQNYLNHFCQKGYPEYLKLRDFQRKYPWLKGGVAISLCHYGDTRREFQGMDITTTFRKGLYVADDIAFADKVCQMALDFKAHNVPFWKDRAFLAALRNLASNSDYNHERMMMKMDYQSAKLVRCADMASYIAVMNDIYNHRIKDSQKVNLRKLSTGSDKYRVDRKRAGQHLNEERD
jgi:hypothetical protein